MVQIAKMVKKLSKMVTKNGQNSLKWSKMVKMVKNGGPDLRRARRIGMSARSQEA